MAAGIIRRQSVELNIEIDKGSTFRLPLEYRSGEVLPGSDKLPELVDVTGGTATLTMRPEGSTDNSNDVVITEAGSIEIGGADGIVAIVIDDSDSSNFTWSKASYTLVLTLSDGEPRQLVHGILKVFDGLS